MFLLSILDSIGVDYKKQTRLGRFYPDAFIEKHSLVIEFDGYYWHVKKRGCKTKDRKRDNYYIKKGYKILRIPETIIMKNPEIAKQMILESTKQLKLNIRH